ncbi:MAG: hypothetical protein EPN30_00305 [Actinomycetota bacterium]|nr:MAG: hypothetical protein EPN30_00305 [Actinomycetota bacterium]
MNPSKDESENSEAWNINNIDFLNGSSLNSESEPGPPFNEQTAEYIAEIRREIEEEVKRKRAQGAFPPAFERRLKTIFERLVPPGAGNSRRDFEALLRSSDRAAYFDIEVPIASQKPGVAKVKKILRITQAWYLNYLAQQLNNFSTNLMRLLYVFDARVKKLEDSSESLNRIRPSGNFLKPVYPNPRDLDNHLLQAMQDLQGRILVADCGNGYLVSAFRERALDCYGVDSFGEELEHPFEVSLDLRWDDLSHHVNEVADHALSGIVLQGSIDLLSPPEKLNLLVEVKRVLSAHAVIAIISTDPAYFQTSPDLVVQRDLAPGRPFAPQTWDHVLNQLGFSAITTIGLENCYLTIAHLEAAENTGGAKTL